MPTRQLLALFTCTLVSLTVGNAITALLPVYLTQLGAEPAITGYFLSLVFLALAAGTVAAGWLSDRLQRRRTLLILAGVISVPANWLISQAITLEQLAVYSVISTFFAGMGIPLVNIIAGMSAEESQRGKVFGVLAFAAGLGGLVGGLAGGPIADRWGFSALYQASALITIVYPLAALLVREPRTGGSHAKSDEKAPLGAAFYILFAANIAAWTAVFVSGMGRPLVMNQIGFDSASISQTVAIGAGVTLPLSPLLGSLSDRMGRRNLIALCYAGGMAGMLVLAASASLWHFWVSSVLVTMIVTGTGIASALVTDVVPPEGLDTAMSLFTSTNLIAGVIGFALTGLVIQGLGANTTFVLGALLPVMAIVLLAAIKRRA